jgi:GntR family transcriptional regulator
MMSLDPRSPVPKHQQLREILIDLIEGEMQPEQAIPSERELSERYGVARMTVRQAVDALVIEGRLFKVAGRGTFVAKPKLDLQIRLTSYTEEMARRGMVPSSRTLVFEQIPARGSIARGLEVEPGELLIRFKRLRYADGVPMAVEQTYVVDSRVPGFADMEPPASLYNTLAEKFGLEPNWGEDSIEAIAADPDIAALLEIPVGGPVLHIERHAYTGETLLDYSVMHFRADRYKLWVPLARPSARITNPRH